MPENLNILLVGGIAVGVAVVTALVVVVYMRARANRPPSDKYELELAHSILTERVRRYQNILVQLPPHYLPRDLKMLLVLGLINALEQQKRLKYPGDEDKVRNKLDSAHDLLRQLNAAKEEPEVRPITRPDKAKEAREILDSVRSFILFMTEQRQMDEARTDEYLEMIDHLKMQTHLDLIDSAARKAAADGDYDTAISVFKGAIEELKEYLSDDYYVDKVAIYNNQINQLNRRKAEESNPGLAM